MQCRDAVEPERAEADRIAIAAYAEYARDYPEWIAHIRRSRPMSQLAREAQLIVAAEGEELLGAVGYVPATAPKAACFEPEWPVLRMLSVRPQARGRGVGRALVEECLARARRDGASVLALFTSPAMTVALPMYERMGFELVRPIAPILGVPCVLYIRRL
jgi:GNAT superfamily N-acetyltransferase